MPRGLKVLLLVLLLAAWGALAIWAQPYPPPPAAPAPAPPITYPPPPFPANLSPGWTPAPGAPRIMYAPNIPGDVFRVGGHKYYYYYRGSWYRGKSPMGPWHVVRKVPRGLYRLPRSAFKGQPPW
jgi:hypothetical protein